MNPLGEREVLTHCGVCLNPLRVTRLANVYRKAPVFYMCLHCYLEENPRAAEGVTSRKVISFGRAGDEGSGLIVYAGKLRRGCPGRDPGTRKMRGDHDTKL